MSVDNWYSVRYDYAGKKRHDYYQDTSSANVRSRLLNNRMYAQNLSIKKLKGEPPSYMMVHKKGKLIRLD